MKTKIHDGMGGAVILPGVVLALKVNLQWVCLACGISVLMISSAFI